MSSASIVSVADSIKDKGIEITTHGRKASVTLN